MTSAYLRSPHLAGDSVVFVADDDVWRVGIEGGQASRITSDRAPVSRPRLSPDGRRLAWASRRDGSPEIYVVPVAGGAPTRLTWWAAPTTRLLGWTDADHVVAATAAGQPFRSHAWAHRLPADGRPGGALPYGPISGLAHSAGGAVVLQSVVHREPATWKRYRGGTAPKLWLDPDGSGTFARFLADLDGQLADPVWCGDRLLFLSDHEGHGNAYSVTAGGSDLRRHSDHTGAYARDLSGDLTGGGSRAVYARAGELWVLEDLAADSTPRRLDVELPGSRTARLPARVETPLASVELDVDVDGRASVATVRGTVQWLPHRDGPVRILRDDAGVRTRLARVLPGRGRSAVWVTDADGDDALEVLDGTDVRRLASGQLGRVLELIVSPDASRVAVASHDGRVLLVGLADGAVTDVAGGTGDSSGLTFSPDGRWLAWSAPAQAELRQLRLADLTTGSVVDATPVRFVDTEPTFTLDGRFLAFLSARTFDPVYDAQSFALAFPVAVRPYLLALRADGASPFAPDPEGRPVEPPAASDDLATVVDLDGLSERVLPVPVAAGRYSHLTAAAGGLLWLAQPLAGELAQDRPADDRRRPALRRWDLPTRRELTVVPELDGYALSKDGKRLAVRDGETLRIGPADRPVDPSARPDGAPSELVEVRVDALTCTPDPVAEWRQMLVETWRLMRDHFWIEDFAGVDWDDVLQRYLPLVDRLASRDDLSEVLWEMVGELGSSHAYERPPVTPPPPGRAAGFLGVDLRRTDDGRWEIARVLPGESSVPAARSPLAAVDVRAGDVLLAVDGRELDDRGPGPLLAGRADVPTEVTVSREGTTSRFAVVPLPDETPLRYQAWVVDRRREVHERSQGRIGYIHLPDMMSGGWAEFHRDLRAELLRDALVVDTRENGGGHISQLVLERLARKPIAGAASRHAFDARWPDESPRGPLVSIANENAGSDGDIVNQGFRELGLGPIVGTRTWGGVIGIDGRYTLVDGTSVTQPRYAFWFAGAGWGVENHGVDPDVEVPLPPQDWAAGRDPQLAEGLRLVTAALDDFVPLAAPDLSSRPDRAAPLLPPRPA